MRKLPKIEEIYHAVVAKPPDERDELLSEMCGGDDELRSEVESLLAFDDVGDDFIESPPDDIAAALFSRRRGPDVIGRTLNNYRILSLLGSGGMGDVYLADDIRLGRKVAIKLLPPHFAASEERRKRFEQEARAVSALNHPNIITIYGIEEAENFSYIATEFIDGKTLRDSITEQPLTASETVEIGIQIAGALEAAHAVGIVHRDIKPANIMIRRDRLVKVLDFGLAKLTGATTAPDDLETLHQTAGRRVMGTISYMSPEQALGERLDPRTDIFSLGVVFYEMLTGDQAFGAGSEAAVYDAILNRDPLPLDSVKPDVPSDLAAVLSQMMAKKPAERFQTAADVRAALEGVRQRMVSGEGAVATRRGGRKSHAVRMGTVAAAAMVLVTLTVSAWVFFIRSSGVVSPQQLTSNIKYTQLTRLSSAEMFPSLAPDGKTFLYSGRADGKWDIFVQRVGGANAVNLTRESNTDNRQAVFSPDGEHIAFRSERDGGGIFLMGATGESVRRLTDFGYNPAWSPDGAEVVFCSDTTDDPKSRVATGTLWTVRPATGEMRRLTVQDAMHPSWSPSGARIAFWGMNPGGQRDIWTISASGESPIQVTDDASIDWNPVWSPDGKYLYFISDRGGSMNLWRVLIDERTGRVSAEPESVPTPSGYSQHPSFSRDGKQFAYVQTTNYSNIFGWNFDPESEKTNGEPFAITEGTRPATNPDVSPNGEWIVFDVIGETQEDLFVVRTDGSDLRQLTDDAYKDRVPRWSADGKRIAFFSDRTGRYEGWVIDVDGSDLQKVTTTTGEHWGQLPLWSPDGTRLLFNRSFTDPVVFDASEPWEGQTPVELSTQTPAGEWIMMFSWSPDGEKIAGWRRTTDSTVSTIVEYSLAEARYRELSDFGARPVWLRDSRRILFISKDKIYLLDSRSRKTREVASVAPNHLQCLTISKNDRTIYYSLQRTESDIWLGSWE